MVDYVLDTEPLVAFLYDEPGHEAVAEVLERVASGAADGLLAEVNASELLYLVARIEGVDGTATDASLRTADRDVRALTRHGLELARADWALAGRVKAHGGIALGDAHAVALAHEHDATLLAGADGEFDELPVEVTVERFRDHGV
ncbi:PIN domain-containing protein [Haloglomus salinum]|jgi:predicted nucleic acid-binding protein|uniref:PIN domain-containing protein n=1 Tax=Haloglomus salinum TaxID=2962673 RepID=UPI0020C965A9|nr:PIN domain-containing protein [Haloglomus salinum]